MKSLMFISPSLPLSRVHCRSNIVSTRRVCPQRVVPRATSSKPNNSLQNTSNYLLYTVTPLLLTNPLSTLAQSTQSADSARPIDPTELTQADLDDSLTSRILGWTAFLLLVVTSVSAIIVSIDNFITSREDKKHRQWVKDRIDGRPYPKDFWSPDEDKTFTKGSPDTAKSMNRESRRMEKRQRDKEQKEKKRREKLAKQREAAKAENEQTKK